MVKKSVWEEGEKGDWAMPGGILGWRGGFVFGNGLWWWFVVFCERRGGVLRGWDKLGMSVYGGVGVWARIESKKRCQVLQVLRRAVGSGFRVQ